jgi:6,7-dimethyl-8-ribityllumazine synthase
VSNAGFHYSPPTPSDIPFNNLKIGVVTSVWNEHITHALKHGCISELVNLGFSLEQIVQSDVPGAFELPLGAQKLFELAQVDAVICLGAVIKGDTPHFDFVCQGATDGIRNVGLKYSKPCIYGLITTLTEQQALDRIGGSHGHKGKEAAHTAIHMLTEFYKL